MDGINQSGSVVLSVRLADDGKCDPWTDVIADEVAAQSELDSQPDAPGTHEFLAQHLADVHIDPSRGYCTPTTSPETSRSPMNAVSQPPTPTAASPATKVAASPASPIQQPLGSGTNRPASLSIPNAVSAESQRIRTPVRAGSPYPRSQAAQQADSSAAAVEQLVANAISAVKQSHHQGDLRASEAAEAATAAAEHQRELKGHGPFLGLPLHPVPGAYCIALMVCFL